LKLVWNGTGLRVDYPKGQGLFNKFAKLKEYVLIWAVGFGSDDPDPIWI